MPPGVLNIGIAGAGLVGRVLGLRLLAQGHRVSLFDGNPPGQRCAGDVAAGMLSPCAELESGEREIYELGVRSLELWPRLLAGLRGEVAFRRRGSLVTAHPRDDAITARFIERIRRKLPNAGSIRRLHRDQVVEIEPGLQASGLTFLLEDEGQVDAQAFMTLSREYLSEHAEFNQACPVESIAPGEIRLPGAASRRFDWVFDCRGIGARPQLPTVRGVRGEVVWLETPEVSLARPVRVMHPRYRIYIVPRPANQFVVGATEIESEDLSPISVRGLMELVSATPIVDPAFLEARVVRTDVQLRPAMPDNQPCLQVEDGQVTINGLFRHGYLLAPALVEDAIDKSINQSLSGAKHERSNC